MAADPNQPKPENPVTTAERAAIGALMKVTSPPMKAVLEHYVNVGRGDSRFNQITRLLDSNDRRAALLVLRSFTEDSSLRLLISQNFADELDSERLKHVMQLYRGDMDEERLKQVLQLARGDLDVERLKTVLQIYRGDYDDQRLNFAIRLLRGAPYMEDLVASNASSETWQEDERFKKAYAAATSISAWGLDIRWRCYTLMKCAERAKDLEGDFVECGVDRGGTAMGVIEYIGRDAFADRLFYLFDTYQGVAPEQMTDVETGLSKLPETRYPDVYEDVVNTYKDMPFAKVVRGRVPETLSEFKGGPVAYLHIDMNVSMPECAALEFYWPHLVKGAPVVFDDYGFPFHSEQKNDLDAVAAKLGSHIMMLPTGQGLMWKT